MDPVSFFEPVRDLLVNGWHFFDRNAAPIQALATSLAVGSLLFAAVQLGRQKREADLKSYLEIFMLVQRTQRDFLGKLQTLSQDADNPDKRYSAIYEFAAVASVLAVLYFNRRITGITHTMVENYLSSFVAALGTDRQFQCALQDGGMKSLKKFSDGRRRPWQHNLRKRVAGFFAPGNTTGDARPPSTP
jgi:hypothetical protein